MLTNGSGLVCMALEHGLRDLNGFLTTTHSSQEAKGTVATGGSRGSPGPLLPHACTCDAATPLRDSLQTEDWHWPMDSESQLGRGQRGRDPKSAWRPMAG